MLTPDEKHFRPGEKEKLLELSSGILEKPPVNTMQICDLQKKTNRELNLVLAYRFIHYKEPPFGPFMKDFVKHIEKCNPCTILMTPRPEKIKELRKNDIENLKKIRPPVNLNKTLEYIKIRTKSKKEEMEYRYAMSFYRLADAFAVKSKTELLLAVTRLKIAGVLESIYDGNLLSREYKTPCQKLKDVKPVRPLQIENNVYDLINGSGIKIPEYLIETIEHVFQCKPCQVAYSIPQDIRESLPLPLLLQTELKGKPEGAGKIIKYLRDIAANNQKYQEIVGDVLQHRHLELEDLLGS